MSHLGNTSIRGQVVDRCFRFRPVIAMESEEISGIAVEANVILGHRTEDISRLRKKLCTDFGPVFLQFLFTRDRFDRHLAKRG